MSARVYNSGSIISNDVRSYPDRQVSPAAGEIFDIPAGKNTFRLFLGIEIFLRSFFIQLFNKIKDRFFIFCAGYKFWHKMMFGRNNRKSLRAKSLRYGIVHLHRNSQIFNFAFKINPLAPAYPIPLLNFNFLEIVHRIQIFIQPIGIFGDSEHPLLFLPFFGRPPAALALSIHHLFVCEANLA